MHFKYGHNKYEKHIMAAIFKLEHGESVWSEAEAECFIF